MGSLLRFALVVGGLPLALLIAMTVLSDGAPFRPFADPANQFPATGPGAAPPSPGAVRVAAPARP
ncbi:MAG: hypothetical protein AB7N54_04670 [Alphaproteobacteria bacterium]